MITAERCIKEIESAMKKYGEYNYFDKGASEVMDMDFVCTFFADMTPKQLADVLAEVRAYDKEHEAGHIFVREVLGMLDSDDKWASLYEDERISDLY